MSDSEILSEPRKDGDANCGEKEQKKKNPNYPIKVIYCPECSRPVEYCEYSEDYAACLQTLNDKLPDIFKEMNLSLDMAKGM